MAVAPKKAGEVVLQKLNIQRMDVPIVGDTPLLCHAWSKKAKQEMLDKQMKKASAGRKAKDPWMDFCESLYWLDKMPDAPTQADVNKARFGFPAIAFKASAVTAVTSTGAMTKVMARQCFHLSAEFVQILGAPPQPRDDMVRVAMGAADIRFRGEFKVWAALLSIQFNANAMSAEQIVNLIEAGGFAVGIGDWRPEKDGVLGRFHVARDNEMEAFL